MNDPLTYPPDIVIESTIDLQPEYDVPEQDVGVEICCELAMVVVELVIGLLGGGS